MECWSDEVPTQYSIIPTLHYSISAALHHSVFFRASAPRIAEVRIATDDKPATTSHEL